MCRRAEQEGCARIATCVGAPSLAQSFQRARHHFVSGCGIGVSTLLANFRCSELAERLLDVALVVLLVGAGLFVHSFRRATSLDLGVAPDGLIFVQPQLAGIATSAEDFDQRMERIEARLRSNAVSNDYFTVMGSPVLKGRAFISDMPPAQFYQPLRQWNHDMRVLFVRARFTDASMQAALRRAMLLQTPNAPYVDVRPMTQIVGDQLRAWQLGAAMFGLFGVLGLAVAAVGLYSVIAHDVVKRTHEIGVRMAPGARHEDVVGLVMRGGLRQASAGLVLGLAISWAASTRVADLPLETSPREPSIYVGVAILLLLLLVAVVASLVPARRAARVNPVEVLRDAG